MGGKSSEQVIGYALVLKRYIDFITDNIYYFITSILQLNAKKSLLIN